MGFDAARAFCSLLAVALAANCFLPCYTLAYADDCQEVAAREPVREDKQERPGNGQALEGPDLQGLLWPQGSEEAASRAQFPYRVGLAFPCASNHVLVEASYRLADSLIRFDAARAFADESQEVDSVPQEEQEEVPDGSAGLEFSPGEVEPDSYGADGSPAVGEHSGDDGAAEKATKDSSESDGGIESPVVAGDGGTDESYGGNFSDSYSSFDDSYQGFYSPDLISPNNSGIMLLAGFGGNLTEGFGGAFSGGSGLGKSANTTDVVDSFTAAWGWGYNTSVVHLYSNSPAGWLRAINNNLYTQANNIGGKVNGMSLMQFANSINDLLKKQWGYGYGGTVVLESNSPASWLQSIKESIGGVQNGSTLSHWVYYIALKTLDVISNTSSSANSLSSISGKIGPLQKDSSLSYWVYYIAEKSASSVGILNTLLNQGVSTSSFLSKGFEDILSKFDDLISLLESSIGFDGNILRLLIGLQDSITAWGSRWDAQDQWLIEWGHHWESQEQLLADWLAAWHVPDLSETNKLLGLLSADVASIRDKYVLGDTLGDLLNSLLGDLKTPATAAALSSLQDAMGKVFPFCVPSIVNMVLFGSVVADPVPPRWEFDIAGTPLVVDFADYGDFAEVCRWTVRLMFTVSLLFGSRRFIYGMGGDD